MDKDFDPYHKWLGIPPAEQPAHLYRLLGLPLFEAEVDVIENCADQRSALLRTFQSGKHSDLSQQLLNEVSAAKLELLDADTKLAYDKKLRAKLKSKKSQGKQQGRPKPKTRESTSKRRAPSQKKKDLPTAEPLEPKPRVSSSAVRRKVRRKKSLAGPAILLGVGGVLAVLIAVVLLSSGGEDPVEKTDSESEGNTVLAEKTDKPTGKTKEPKQPEKPKQPDSPKQPDKPVVPEPKRPSPEVKDPPVESALTETVNLLGLIDPKRHSIQGDWKVENGVVISPPKGLCVKLKIPFKPPEEYQIDMVVVHKQGDDCLTMGLICGENRVAAVLDGWHGKYCGLDVIDGKRPSETKDVRSKRIFEPGQKREISYQVRPTEIRVLVDGDVVIQWEGDSRRFSMHEHWETPSEDPLFLGEFETVFEFHKLTIGPIRQEDSPRTTASSEPRVFLDDLQEASFVVGWGSLGKHGATAYPNKPGQPKECRYQDQVPDHALSAVPKSDGSSHVTYYLDGKYEKLHVTGALIQAAHKPEASTPIVFKVFGDGVMLWESQPIERLGEGEDCRVSVAGVHVLRLQVDCSGPNHSRHAAWINPHVISSDSELSEEQPEVERLALPDPESRDVAEAKIRELFEAEFKEATSADKKLSLAEQFLELAHENSDDPVARFVLFQQGWTLAVDAGVAEPALRAVVDLAGLYDVDSLKMRVSTLTRVARKASGREKSADLATDALPIIEEALRQEDYAAAEEIGKIALAAARKASDKDLVKQIVARNRFTGEIAKAAEEAKYAQATLQSDPQNPGANLTAGRFLCFLKDDWPAGLPLLALSGNDALEQVAKAELAEPSDPADHAKLGGMWWELAKDKSDVIRQRLLQRSAFWYRLAQPQLRDRELKATIEKRLTIIDGRYGAGNPTSRLVEAWISSEATYTVTSQFKDKRPLAALLTDDESLHANGEFSFHTAIFDPAPAVVIDLQKETPVTRILIENRRKPELFARARGLTLWLSNSPSDRGEPVWTAPTIAASWEVKLKKPIEARYVTLATPPVNRDRFHLAKVKVFGLTTQNVAAKPTKPGTVHRVLGYELKKHPEGAVPFGGHWYSLISQGTTWLAAQQRCKQMGGYLICIETPAEAQLAWQLSAGHQTWCGGVKVNNRWGWINGSPIAYFNWKGREPNNAGGLEDRIEIDRGGRWNDIPGGKHHRFICEWEF